MLMWYLVLIVSFGGNVSETETYQTKGDLMECLYVETQKRAEIAKDGAEVLNAWCERRFVPKYPETVPPIINPYDEPHSK